MVRIYTLTRVATAQHSASEQFRCTWKGRTRQSHNWLLAYISLCDDDWSTVHLCSRCHGRRSPLWVSLRSPRRKRTSVKRRQGILIYPRRSPTWLKQSIMCAASNAGIGWPTDTRVQFGLSRRSRRFSAFIHGKCVSSLAYKRGQQNIVPTRP